jgi:hypothetical protein
MTALRLIPGEASGAEGPETSFHLDQRSRRPGLAHEEILLELDFQLRNHLSALAAADGLPPALYAVIAIEAQRALHAVASEKESVAVLERELDWAARRPPPERSRATRLAAYAAALRRASPAPHLSVAPHPLALLVPYHTLITWELSSGADGLALSDWASKQLAGAAAGRSLWEAAAAEHGQTLAEWIGLRAARPSRRG